VVFPAVASAETFVASYTGPLIVDVGTDVTNLGSTITGGSAGIAGVDGLLTKLGETVTSTGTTVTKIGTGLNASGLASLPVVGTTLGSVNTTVSGTVDPLLSITVLNKQLSGSPSGAELLNATVLSNNLATGAPINASVLSGGHVLKLGSGSSGLLSGLAGSTPSGAAGSVSSGLSGTVSGITGGTVLDPVGGIVTRVTTTVTTVTAGLSGGTTQGLLGGLLTNTLSSVKKTGL
jgi:hypothetical protein